MAFMIDTPARQANEEKRVCKFWLCIWEVSANEQHLGRLPWCLNGQYLLHSAINLNRMTFQRFKNKRWQLSNNEQAARRGATHLSAETHPGAGARARRPCGG
jgi:hypothetical protein